MVVQAMLFVRIWDVDLKRHFYSLGWPQWCSEFKPCHTIRNFKAPTQKLNKVLQNIHFYLLCSTCSSCENHPLWSSSRVTFRGAFFCFRYHRRFKLFVSQKHNFLQVLVVFLDDAKWFRLLWLVTVSHPSTGEMSILLFITGQGICH